MLSFVLNNNSGENCQYTTSSFLFFQAEKTKKKTININYFDNSANKNMD